MFIEPASVTDFFLERGKKLGMSKLFSVKNILGKKSFLFLVGWPPFEPVLAFDAATHLKEKQKSGICFFFTHLKKSHFCFFFFSLRLFGRWMSKFCFTAKSNFFSLDSVPVQAPSENIFGSREIRKFEKPPLPSRVKRFFLLSLLDVWGF